MVRKLVVGIVVAAFALTSAAADERRWDTLADLRIIEAALKVAFTRNPPDTFPDRWVDLRSFDALPDSVVDRIPTRDPWHNRYLVRLVQDELLVLSPGPDGSVDVGPGLPDGLNPLDCDDMLLVYGGIVLNGPRSLEQHQQLSMRIVRLLGSAVEEFAIDYDRYPGLFGALGPVTLLDGALSPAYLRRIPASDSWGNEIFYWSDERSYMIVSAGADGLLDRDYDPRTIRDTAAMGAVDDPDRDIVFADGTFEQWPRSRASPF